MKKIFALFSLILFFTACLSAQKDEFITVRAGTRVQDYFPFKDRYRFPMFMDGKVFYSNGAYSATKLNYNYLSGEMEYIQSRDTLSIENKTDILRIDVAKDTFFFDKGYLELICSGKVRVAIRQYITTKEVMKRDGYGVASSNAATDSYSSVQSNGIAYKLVSDQDRVFQKISKFYLATSSSGFVPFTRKKVLQLFPKQADPIEDYLKSNKVDFDSRDDLLRLAAFLKNI